MQTVTSKDGTRIAFDQAGQGPPVILVGGAFSFRTDKDWKELIDLLSPYFTVINYDRRGRGESADTTPYAAEREFEDLEALIHHVGGAAFVFGQSSGAILVIKAAAYGLNITKLALYEPPFEAEGRSVLPEGFVQHLTGLIAADRRGEAVRLFLTKVVGIPRLIVLMMRFKPGLWRNMTALAHTLPYDIALVFGDPTDVPMRTSKWASVGVPTAVISGGKSAEPLRRAAEAVTEVLSNATLQVLEGQTHSVSGKVLAPVLIKFFKS